MNLTALSPQSVQAMTKDKNCLLAAETLFKAMALSQTMREIVVPIQQEVLDRFKFPYAEYWTEMAKQRDYTYPEALTKLSHTYMLGESDFLIFMTETRTQYKEKGIMPYNPDHCPLLVAEHLQVEAEWALMDAIEPFTGIGKDDLYNMDHRKAYLDLNLKLFSQHIKELKH